MLGVLLMLPYSIEILYTSLMLGTVDQSFVKMEKPKLYLKITNPKTPKKKTELEKLEDLSLKEELMEI